MANQNIKQVIRRALFNEKLFGETITYNGKEIMAICQVGESEVQTSPSFLRMGNSLMVSSDARFTVSTEDAPNPKQGDVILYNGETYHVSGITLHDSVGGNVTVKAVGRARGMVRR
ncbi:hypothetical protein [Phascolarctobacterium sp.]|uniref:head-tail joining protein n=1 Tax=Phascolarctobacterium sp. TaxID=2049039 RepID=UPI00386795E5